MEFLLPVDYLAIGTVAAALFLVPIYAKLSGALINAATAYWVAWVSLSVVSTYTQRAELNIEMSMESVRLIFLLHAGATAGFFIGAFISASLRKNDQIRNNSLSKLYYYNCCLRKLLPYVLIPIFVMGSLHFLEKLAAVGFNPFTFMRDLRYDYLGKGMSPLGRVTQLMYLFAFALAPMLGYFHAVFRVRFKELIFCVIACAPHGLAMGGRIFLFGLFFPYVTGFGLSFQGRLGQLWKSSQVRGKAWKLVRNSLIYTFIFLMIFTAIGIWRTPYQSERAGINSVLSVPLSAFKMASSWLGASLPAVEPAALFQEANTIRGYGRSIFFWPARQMERLKILPKHYDVQRYFNMKDFRAEMEYVGTPLHGYVPPTVIAYLVEDFGLKVMPLYMAFLAAGIFIVSCSLRYANPISISFAVWAINAAAFTIQSNSFFSSQASLPLFYGIVFTALCHFGRGSIFRSIQVRR